MTLKKLLKLAALSFCLVALFACFVSACVLFLVLEDFSRELPVLESARYKPQLTTKLYDCQGELISELQGEKNRREVVPISRIPVHTQRAFVAVEDERFYRHYGVDPRAVVRAMVRNLKAGRIVEGGSTITQQLAKNRFLKSERTWTRRMKDTILAIRFERNYTKDEILGQYLNEIFFGGQIYGIASAAQYYFGKRVEELTLAESAILAGMLPAPNRYSPLRKNKAWKQRQRIVLQKMWKQGYITKQQALDAYMEELHVVGRMDRIQRAPYFADLVRRRLVALFGPQKAYNGGLRVFTSLDLRTQAEAEKIFHDAAIFKRYPARDYPKMQGAMVVLNPLDGSIRALIGGRDYLQSQFDRSTQARRQPGSAFKPFVYCTAFKQGISPNVILTDEPVRYLMPNTDEYWEPRNYTERFHGPVILSTALEHSYNIVAIKLLDQVGIENVINLAKRLGIESPLEPDLSLALGSSEVSLLEMASAYGTFANQGIRVTPRAILRVEDGDGTVLYENDMQEYEALDERIAYLTTKVLEGVLTRGTGVKARVPGFEIAGKTGTTNDYTDGWFLAYTPELVVGAYFGFDDSKSMGEGMSAAKVAVPVVGSFLKSHLKSATPSRFVRPPGVESIKVCRDTGFLALSSCRSVALPFLKGKAPDSYCHLHQPIDFSVSDLRRRIGPPASTRPHAPAAVHRLPAATSRPAFEAPSPMAVYEALPSNVTARSAMPGLPDVAGEDFVPAGTPSVRPDLAVQVAPSSPASTFPPAELGNHDLPEGGAPALDLGPSLDLSLGN